MWAPIYVCVCVCVCKVEPKAMGFTKIRALAGWSTTPHYGKTCGFRLY